MISCCPGGTSSGKQERLIRPQWSNRRSRWVIVRAASVQVFVKPPDIKMNHVLFNARDEGIPGEAQRCLKVSQRWSLPCRISAVMSVELVREM
jgi:hypothetical protein